MAKAAKTIALLQKEESQALERYCVLHQLKDALVGFLKFTHDKNDLRRGDITTAMNAPYEKLLQAVGTAISNGWASQDEFTSLLDKGELAGRQHLCIFKVRQSEQAKVIESLRKPIDLDHSLPTLESFYLVPAKWSTRILQDTQHEFLAKIVGPREYWDFEEKNITADHIQIDKYRRRERSVIIVKYNYKTKLLQLRLSLRRNGNDTGRAVHDFLTEAVGNQFGDSGRMWFGKLEHFPIADSYAKIVGNRDDFVLIRDTPYDNEIAATLSKKVADYVDLRDNPHWTFDQDFARTSIRGIWLKDGHKDGDEGINAFLHLDDLKLDAKTRKKVARVFFVKSCPDEEIEHVLRRIREHIP